MNGKDFYCPVRFSSCIAIYPIKFYKIDLGDKNRAENSMSFSDIVISQFMFIILYPISITSHNGLGNLLSLSRFVFIYSGVLSHRIILTYLQSYREVKFTYPHLRDLF